MQASTLLFATLFALTLAPHFTSAQSTFQVVPFRSENFIELECRDLSNGSPVERAQYWLNTIERDQELRRLDGVRVFERLQGRIGFTITRELEGTYFCGRDLVEASQEGVDLIAFPDPTIRPSNVRTFYSKAGTSARLNCSILPGALRGQYYTDWRNATSGVDVARIVGPRTLPQTPSEDPRYMVNSEDFSLMIDPVRLTDAGTYLCVLGVRDPAGQMQVYPVTEKVELTLIVYQAPLITEPPQDQVIALNTTSSQSVTFSCQARGEPAPEIEWTHNSNEVENSAKYQIRQFAPVPTADGDFIVTSELRINDVDAFDNGEVTCVTEAELDSNDEDFDVDLQSSSSTAILGVIGNFNSIDLLISTNGDVIFKLGLPSEILVPVQLSICYIDANDPGAETSTRVTSTMYQNTSKITHFEPSLQVPSFDNVRVKIALRYQRMQGPFSISAQHDLRVATVFTQDFVEAGVQKFIIISAAASVVLIAALVAVVILVLACIWQRYKRRKADKQLKEREAANMQELRNKVVEGLVNNPDEKRSITLKLGGMVISIQGNSEACEGDCDMVDGPMHTECPAHAHSKRPPLRMLTRGGTFDLDDVSSVDSGIQDEKCAVDAMKSIVRASITHPKIGPALKRFVSTEIGFDT